MSRCLPFPPPGYERKLVLPEEVLIESIKREQECANHSKKVRRKEKKREKKEKKEKKEKEKKTKASIEQNYSSHKKRPWDEECNVDYRAEFGKKREDESEHLEKSSLTEEHGQPASVLNHCDSSDSTQSSSKKQKHSFLSDSSHNQSTVLRFRLPLLKPKGLKEPSSEERQCSTSGCVEINAHNKGDVAPRLIKEQSCSTSKRIEIPAQDVVESAAKSSSFGSGSPDLDAQLRDLIENWVPPPIQIEHTDSDDQEWLFNVSHKQEAKRYKAASNSGTHENCSKAGDGAFSCWPRARYLHEADIYALPYTVPY